MKEFYDSCSLKSNKLADEAIEDGRTTFEKRSLYYFTCELAWLEGVKTLRAIW